MTETAALIACGIDGGKAIAESFKQNAPYFIFIRCFIHYKGNINAIKFCRLIDFSSNDQFAEKLKSLKPFWYARDLDVSEKPTSHKWFVTGKVDSCTYVFYPAVSIPNTDCFSRWWLLLGGRKSAPKKLKNNFSKISYIFKDSCTLLNCFYILSNLKSN